MRADRHYGNQSFMRECETRGLPYLFKLRHSPKVKTLVRECMRQSARWEDAGPGWQGMHTMLKLAGWCAKPPRWPPWGENKRRRRDHQSELPGTETADWQPAASF